MATSLTTRGKGITLEDWESKTQLTETQKVSVLELQDACKELPLPEGVRTNQVDAVSIPLNSSHISSAFPLQFLTDLQPGTPQPHLTSSPSLREPIRTNSSPLPHLHLSGLSLPRSRSTTSLLAELQSSELAAGGASIDAALGLGKPIETTQQFFDWFAKMEADMEKDQEDVYRLVLVISE